ncbi:MAG: TIGR03118 family protein [Bryobacteraceae bacterium]
MKAIHTLIKTALLVLVGTVLTAAFVRADTYSWQNFQSDIAGVAWHVDSNLVNAWGMAASPSGIIWVSDNGTGVATLYNQDGTANSLVVATPGRGRHHSGNPTGTVFNGTGFFKVTKNGNSQPSLFIFVNEDGTISGWSPTLDSTNAIVAVRGSDDNVYKAATLGVADGHNFLYVTNFHKGKVETFDENFHRVDQNGFADPHIAPGFAPFAIRNINGQIYVTYAKQDPDKHDDVPGPGNGFVNVFDTSGNLIRRLVSHGNLNSPWGLALIEGDELWVGNFGDGKINNYDPTTGAFLGTVNRGDGTPLQFDALWDLLPLGTGVYFTAGIADEGHGLFGIITEN